jgi:hypothetical protein
MAISGPKRLQKYLPGGLASALNRHTDESGRLKNAWNSVTSEQLGAHTRPVRYADRTLYVHVDTPAWASRLRQQQQTLVSALRQVSGLKDLAEIRFRVVPLEGEPSLVPTRERPSRLSSKVAAHIEQSADTISDPLLKAALKRLAQQGGGKSRFKQRP